MKTTSLFFLLALLCVSSQANAQSYEILAFEGDAYGWAALSGINDSGYAVGWRYVYQPTGKAVEVFPYSLPLYGRYSITDITNNGEYVGTWGGCAGISLCFTHPLDEARGGIAETRISAPMSVSGGSVVGKCYSGDESFVYYSTAACGVLNGNLHYFRFSEDTLPQFLFFRDQAATGVNSSGTVAGYAYTQAATDGNTRPDEEEVLRAFSYTEQSGITDLGTLGGQDSSAADINDAGTIVGWAERSDGTAEAFALAQGGAMGGLGIPQEHSESQATAVNSSGTVVGYATATTDGSPTLQSAFVYTAGTGMRLADDLLLPSFGQWHVTGLNDINANGEAVGTAQLGETEYGVILRPVSQNTSFPQALRVAQEDDRLGDFLVWRPASGTWYAHLSTIDGNSVTYDTVLSRQWGLPGDIPVFYFDGDGDGSADLTVWRPATGTWYSCRSQDSFDCSQAEIVQFGLPGDIPVLGDFDGDGKSDYAVFRRSLPLAGIIGTWYVKPSSGDPMWLRQWGLAEDYPVPADYDGDGLTDLAVFRPSTATWFVIPSAGASGSFIAKQWGLPADQPLAHDADGDGKSDFVVFRPGSALRYVCGSRSDFSCTDAQGLPVYEPIQYGLPGDVPLTVNFSGGRTFPAAVWRPVDYALSTVGMWYVNIPSAEQSLKQWGLNGDIPAGVGVRDLLRLTGQE
jgi:probable HAF family extracellular repeat protein